MENVPCECRAQSVEVGCRVSIFESTTGTCTRGDDTKNMRADTAGTYSTFLDWKNHLSTTHGHCMEVEDPLWLEEYAAGFKLDQWGRFHELGGSETDRAYQRVQTLREQYGRYQGQGEGQPQGPPSTIRLPHTKGTTPYKDMTPMESDLEGSERAESGPEEGEVKQEEEDNPGPFTQMRSRDTDTESEDTTPGRDSWRSARVREAVLLTTPRTRGRGKRLMDRDGGAAKRSRMESSSSDRRERPGREGRRAARPMTPPHRPPAPSTSPRRSPRLS